MPLQGQALKTVALAFLATNDLSAPLDFAMPKVCEACGQEGADKCCSGCKEAFYCSIACQTQHWKAGHKHKCFKAEKPSASAAAATAAATAAAAPPRPAAAGGAAQGSGGGGAGARHDAECAICLDALQQPQTMPCGHRFCRGCVASMRRHGAAVAQVCPLCRGAMPDAERLQLEAYRIVAQHERWAKGQPAGAPLPAAMKEWLEKAAALSREALAIDPADACARFSLGYALGKCGDAVGAEAAFRAAIAADPQKADAHSNLGVLLSERGDKAGAEAAYRAAIAADPQKADAHSNLGVLLNERGDKAGAEAAYRAVIAADPQHAAAHCNLGVVLGERGDLAGAARLFAAAFKIDPSIASAKANLQQALRMLKDERQR
jgi:tetratricopeptide (TPR) repeat protein